MLTFTFFILAVFNHNKPILLIGSPLSPSFFLFSGFFSVSFVFFPTQASEKNCRQVLDG
jgi:hypothetical protein